MSRNWSHRFGIRELVSKGTAVSGVSISSSSPPASLPYIDKEAPSAPVLADPPTSITTTEMTISWTASTDNVGVAGYQIYRNDIIFNSVAPGTTSYAFSGLTPGTRYRFFVKAFDANGNISTPSNTVSAFTTATDTTPPSDPVIASPADNITETSVTFHWAASTDDVGVTTYRIFRDSFQIASQIASILSYTDTGISPSSTHAYNVAAVDLAGNVSNLSNALLVTTVDITAPSIPTIASPADTITTTSITFHWSASTDNVGVNHYSVFRDGILIGTTNSSTTTYTDSGLTNNTQYAYTVKAFDVAGNGSSASNTLTVTTLSSADVTPPTAPVIVTPFDDIADTSMTFHWTASTDNVGVTAYNIYIGGVLNGSVDGSTTSYQATGLTQNTQYAFTVKALDAAGNISAASNQVSRTTTTSADTTPPSAPVIATPADTITTTSITFHWTASTDNVSVSGYQIFKDGTLIATQAILTYTAINLSPSTQYNFTVKAFDPSFNISAASTSLVVTTATPPDTQAPTAPVLSNPPTNITITSMTLNWSASTDNVGVTGYLVYRDGNLLTTLGNVTTYAASGLTAGTTYTWTIKATDLAGNLSAASNAVTATTAVPPAFQRPYGDAAAWNLQATGMATHANSAAMVAQLCAPTINWNCTGFSSTDYSYPVYYTKDTTDTYTVSCTDTSANWNNQSIAWNSAWQPANNGGDRQAILLDETTGREWNFYFISSIDQTAKIIHCTRCNVVPVDVNGSLTDGIADYRTKTKGCIRFRGVGIQYLMGLIRPEEIKQGVIEHALSMPIPNPSCGTFYNPSTKAEGYNDGSLSSCLSGTPNPVAISSLTHSGTTATATVASTAALSNGQIVYTIGATDSLYNGPHFITVASGTTFTYTMTGTPASNASGTLTYQTGGIPEGSRFRGTWTDADINSWLATINTRIINAGGSAATSTGIQNLARCIAVAMREYGWFVTDHSGIHHIQSEIVVSANMNRGRTTWTELNIPVNTAYGSKTYPQDLLDGLINQNNVIAIDGTASYPSNTGAG